jgi:hypothetical protein
MLHMATNTRTASRATPKKAKVVSAKKTTASKSRAKKRAQSVKPAATTVDYYPNRMTLAVSVLAGTVLVLVALIAVLGSQ